MAERVFVINHNSGVMNPHGLPVEVKQQKQCTCTVPVLQTASPAGAAAPGPLGLPVYNFERRGKTPQPKSALVPAANKAGEPLTVPVMAFQRRGKQSR